MLQGEVLTQVGDRKTNDGGRRQGSDLLTSVPFRSGGRCVGKEGYCSLRVLPFSASVTAPLYLSKLMVR